MSSRSRLGAAVVAATVLAGVGAGVPASAADGPLPSGISAWVLRAEYPPPAWDGFYVKRTGDWLKFAYVNGLEGACGKGTLNGSSASLKRYGYGPARTARSTFRRSGKKLFVTTYWSEGTSTQRYIRKPLGKAERLLDRGRQADLSARAVLRSC